MISFDLDFYRLKEIDDCYILKFKKVNGNLSSYRDICTLVLTDLRNELV